MHSIRCRMDRLLRLTVLLEGLLFATVVFSDPTAADSDVDQAGGPCKDDSAILLPRRGACLAPVQNASDWVTAQRTCERDMGGTLYRLEEGDLRMGEPLARCLAAMPSTADQRSSDFWIGVVGSWSPHWYWINNTLLNPIVYSTFDREAFAVSTHEIKTCSYYLSVDFCVNKCHNVATTYTVIARRMAYPCCFCTPRLDMKKLQLTSYDFVNYSTHAFQVVESREGRSIGIELQSSESFSETEILCATVDTDTYSNRGLKSLTCFSEAPSLCNLGGNRSLSCNFKGQNCEGTRCRFLLRGDCIQRDSRPETWFAARTDCLDSGGDLWTVDKIDDMYQVSQYLSKDKQYWVGATTHVWTFRPDSNVFGGRTPDYQQVRCGHAFMERGQWKWATSNCDQKKIFICQYGQTTTNSSNITTSTDEEVVCPWPVPTVVPKTTDSGATVVPRTTVTSNATGFPVTAPFRSSTSPLIAIIAACIAALLILFCAIFMLVFDRRRKWLGRRWARRSSVDYAWPLWAPSPAPSHLALDRTTSDTAFDSFSAAHAGMNGAAGGVAASDLAQSSEHRRWREGGGGGGMASGAVAGAGGGGGGGGGMVNGGFVESHSNTLSAFGAGEGAGLGMGVAEATNDHLLSASYASMSPRSREYMTLSAHMTVPDETEVTTDLDGDKPEVALVTNDVDLNFTVNHAFARQRYGVGPVGDASLGNSDIPEEATVQVPTRTVEESIIYP